MALRTVTDFDFDYDEDDIRPKSIILPSNIDKIIENQQFCLDARRLVASDVFTPRTGDAGSSDAALHGKLRGADLMGTAATVNLDFWAYCWSDGAPTAAFTVVLSTSTGSGTSTISVSSTSDTPSWRQAASGITYNADATEEDFSIAVTETAGGYTAYIAGFAIFVN